METFRHLFLGAPLGRSPLAMARESERERRKASQDETKKLARIRDPSPTYRTYKKVNNLYITQKLNLYLYIKWWVLGAGLMPANLLSKKRTFKQKELK